MNRLLFVFFFFLYELFIEIEYESNSEFIQK